MGRDARVCSHHPDRRSHAITFGHTGRYVQSTPSAQLAHATPPIAHARAAATIGRGLAEPHTRARLLRTDLMMVDDIGLLPVGADAAEAFYRSSTPPTNAARWRSRPTSTPPGSTSSCPRLSPPPAWTGCRTTPTSCSRRVTPTDSKRPPLARGWCADLTPVGNSDATNGEISVAIDSRPPTAPSSAPSRAVTPLADDRAAARAICSLHPRPTPTARHPNRPQAPQRRAVHPYQRVRKVRRGLVGGRLPAVLYHR
jgi:hypothetical protein